MKIKDILTLDFSEDIKNVIDLEDVSEAEIKTEIEGYIVTEGLAKEYDNFVSKYTSNISETGVWISGFYGSGKSYFGKLLGYMLSNQTIAGTPARDRILLRFGGIDNEALVKNSISRLDTIASKVVFLDIAKQDTSKGFAYALFRNFLRTLNLPQDEHGILLYSLMLENRQLNIEAFVQKNAAVSWKEIRNKRIKRIKTIKRLYLNQSNTESEYTVLLETIRRDIDQFSAVRLKEEINNYLEVKNDERIVFLFDEASEALNQQKFNLLDLEGVSEALSTLGGQVWTIAIAQEKLDDVINNSNVNKAQLTKVTDRFRTKIHLEATEVDIIIKNRLLKKNNTGIQALQKNYQKKSGQIQDHSKLVGSGIAKTDSFETYVTYYPFYKYQFDLLQNFLFGTKGYASTKVAARGMIITAYDILKQDVKDVTLFDTVTGWQIAKQGEPQPNIRLVNRYDTAERILKESQSPILGRELLETIHLLTEAEVTPPNIANITKAFISNPDDYHKVQSDIQDALNQLTDAKVLLDTNKTYRITSDIEQRLLDEMSSFAVQGFTKKKELVKMYKEAKFTKDISKVMVDNANFDMYITTDNEDELTRPARKALKIKIKSIYNIPDDRLADIEQIKSDFQQDKNTIWVVPDNRQFKEIDKLIDEVQRINYLEQKYNNPKSDEGKIMASFLTSREEKQKTMTKLVEEAFINGDVIYLFNTYKLTKRNWEQILKTQRQDLVQNIYSKRLSNQLRDSLAKIIIKERNNNRLQNHFTGTGTDFAFFDAQGNFVGDRLKVVEEILYKIRNTFVDGGTLEKELEQPPTGFAFGTVMSSLAALMRANKVIVKYDAKEFYSWQDQGISEVFSIARKFRIASFKAISKSLSASDKQAIAQFLLDMDVAKYRDASEVRIDFNTNDFQLVNAVRGLAKYAQQLVQTLKRTEKNFDTLFPQVETHLDYLRDFTGAVSESNYIDKAEHFLTARDDFYDAFNAIEKVQKFIEKKLPKAKEWKHFVSAVNEELNKATQKNANIEDFTQNFNTAFDENLVKNYQSLRQLNQKIKDEYFQLFQAAMEDCATKYKTLEQQATELLTEIHQLPTGLNDSALHKAKQHQRFAQLRTQSTIRIDQEVKDKSSRFTYSEVLSSIDLYSSKQTELNILKASLVREAPQPPAAEPEATGTTTPITTPITPPTPKVHTYKTAIPSKKMMVAAYKNWLMNELRKLANAKDDDQIEIS